MADLGLEPLETRRRMARLAMMHKIIHGLVAIPPQGHISFNNRTTRRNNPLKLNVYSPNTNAFKHSFFPQTIPLWNELKGDFVNETDHNKFKIQLNKHSK